MNEPIKLVTTKSDAELAQELKLELIQAAQPWIDACTKAHKAGFLIGANFGPDYSGKYIIQTLTLSKQF